MRILLISSEIPQTTLAGGLLLHRLLKYVERGDLVVIGEAARPDSELLDCPYHAPRLPWRRLERSRFNKLHRTLRTVDAVPLLPVAEADGLLAGFRPDVVVTVMQFATWYESARAYAQAKGLPLVTIVHDVNEAFDRVYPWARSLQRRADGRFYRFAKRRLCVSPEMEERCFREYGVHGDVMYPNRDEDLTPRPIEENLELRTPGRLTVGYVGTLGYGYGDQLVRWTSALEACGARLVVYGHVSSSPAGERLRSAQSVEMRGFAPAPEAWRNVKRDCDIVVLPYRNPMDPWDRELYSYHFPSKLTEYLALGMPVLVAGPEEATGVRWAKANPDAAIAVTDSSPEAFGRQLARLSRDGGLRRRLAAGAVDAAAKCFDPSRIRRQFFAALQEAAGQ